MCTCLDAVVSLNARAYSVSLDRTPHLTSTNTITTTPLHDPTAGSTPPPAPTRRPRPGTATSPSSTAGASMSLAASTGTGRLWWDACGRCVHICGGGVVWLLSPPCDRWRGCCVFGGFDGNRYVWALGQEEMGGWVIVWRSACTRGGGGCSPPSNQPHQPTNPQSHITAASTTSWSTAWTTASGARWWP